ncbi:MAG TPA: translation elongation factor Ts [Gemmataceae bacterium]|nr:translation elongation factor Ts [Gemmataceae bacterium]
MSQISSAAVKALRDRTNAPMMECKAALTEANGDMEKAVEILRKKSKDVLDKKGARETAEGRIAAYVDPARQVGSLVEMRCESAPVAKSELFVKLADDIARQVALQGAATIEALLAQPFVDDPKRTVADRITETVGLIRENMRPVRLVQFQGLVGSYIHHDASIGVLVQVEGASADPQLLRDVCMHIAARSPLAVRREDLPAAMIEKEKEIAKSQIAADPRNKNKPANILDKIVEGKLKTWFAENVLVEQPFIKDDTKTVGDVLKAAGLTLVRFVRYKVGEVAA